MLIITPFYAAIFGLMLVYLSLCVIKQRRNAKVSLGDGDSALRKAIAVHNNFSQYVPFALLLMLITFIELNHLSMYIVQGLCASLLIGGITHAYDLVKSNKIIKLRQLGMALTFSTTIATALCLLSYAI